ncbi:E3 ubiquitin-protein ligase E3D isoform X2 [Latimeria chalumnae]|uniref:E3 ubiquitin-protein ligase E3D isoform X2 n=1 Tax=Latimeria chalumnae TaxID=7897 RepID=UPI00313CDE6F
MEASIFLEIRKRMQSGHLVIRDYRKGPSAMDISVKPSSLQLKVAESCEHIELPAGVRIVPSSCRGLQYVNGDGLHMNLEIHTDFSSECVPSAIETLKPQETYVFHCQTCKEIVINKRSFRRVLPLPSGNWSALVEEWCCHPDPFANRKLRPLKDDCFLGDTFILVNSASVSSSVAWEPKASRSDDGSHHPSGSGSTRKSSENTKAICNRCRAMLGEIISADTVKFYITELMFQPTCEDINKINQQLRGQFVEGVIAQCLVELSTVQSSFRFLVQGHDGQMVVLVWLLNSDTLLVGSARNSASRKGFALLEEQSNSRLRPNEARNVLKVLYHPCSKSKNKDIVGAWEKDIGVYTLTFPRKTCLELLLILSSSTESLPPSLRNMNAFQVAFLKLC